MSESHDSSSIGGVKSSHSKLVILDWDNSFGFRKPTGEFEKGAHCSSDLRKFLPLGFPEIVCLCGSTRFKEAYERANAEFGNQGKIVLSVSRFGHIDGLEMEGGLKKSLDELHLRKIDLADVVFIVNDFLDGKPYIGKSTRNEIAYARSKGKRILYLNVQEEDE